MRMVPLPSNPPRHRLPIALLLVSGLLVSAPRIQAEPVESITQYGITWRFDKPVESGQFVTGDPWVIGPVNVIAITNDLNSPDFEVPPGVNGSMVNPGTDDRQGYDSRLSSYEESLNAALPNGSPISKSNPLSLAPGSSLVSMVSWLFRAEGDAEPGAPRFTGSTNAPRPITRSGAVLTVLDKAPPPNSFRPPYSGDDKTVKFTTANLDRSKLKSLPPPSNAPSPAQTVEQIRRPWIDHVHKWLGAMIHPSENMPNYGREIAVIINHSALLLNLDFESIPGAPSKDELLIPFVQMGIDFAGIADAGGGWPADGGHGPGRKLPILMAGVLLNDDHMKNAGNWDTQFQEDEQTFFVSEKEVAMTSSGRWSPDVRGGPAEPYTKDDIGMAEWGIRHTETPEKDNRAWSAIYRSINNTVITGAALAARIMDLEKAWNHPPFFAYADRVMASREWAEGQDTNRPSPFVIEAWDNFNPTPAKQ